MNRKAQKRLLRIRLAIVYTVMVLVVVLLVTGLYFIIQGYRYNQYDGKFEQGGLVQFGTFPSGADVWLDQVHLANKTPSSLTVGAGNHTVTMSEAGYDTWQKAVTVRAGAVLWLDYARLVPQKLVATTPIKLAGAASGKVSYDTNTFAVIENATQPTVTLVGLNTDTPQSKQVTLPTGSYTAPSAGESQTFKIVSWSYDNRYILIKHTYGTNVEWISLDTNNTSVAKNITTTLGVNATDVQYTPNDANALYLLSTDGIVRKVDIDAKTMSGPLLTNVHDFSIYNTDTLVYTTNADPTTHVRTAGYLTPGASAPRVFYRTAPNDTAPLFASINKYYGSYYEVIAHGTAVQIYTGSLTTSDTQNPAPFSLVTTLALNAPVEYLGFSPDQHRFVYAGGSSSVVTYDLDSQQASPFTLQSPPLTQLDWIDDFHFVTVEGTTLRMYDYDGTNGHDMMQNALPLDVSLLQDGKYLNAITKTGSTVAITRDTMIVGQ